MAIAKPKLRALAALLSLLVGLGVMAMKFWGYRLTGSTAILSDAIESMVNVVAAGFALWAVRAAEAPPDEEHPYGHGKLEFVTAVFEGGLITFAALMIGYEAIVALVSKTTLPILNEGMWVVALASGLNGLLGFFLVRVGRSTASLALVADGKHVLSDCVSSFGMLAGLFVVKATGFVWLDPVIALLLAIFLARTGIPLVRQAADGLIDAADPTLLRKLLASLEKNRQPGLIRVHYARAMRNGRRIHVDGHLVMPEFWPIEKAHDLAEEYERKVIQEISLEGEMEFHVDPCRRAYCQTCDLPDCPVREEAFLHRPPLNLRELLSPVDITDRPKP